MRFLATLTTLAFLIPGTLILGLLAVLLAWVPPRGSAMLFLARLWAHCLMAAAWVRVHVEVDPAVDRSDRRERAYVFLSNHQSYLDIPVLLTLLPGPPRFAAKKSLFSIPVFGWSLRAGGFIPVDRKNPRQAREVYAIAAGRVREGSPVLFFPEGTRTRDGSLGTFHRGGFLVAQKAGTEIVPVGIDGTWRVLPRQRFSISPATVTVRVGAPIDTSEYPVSRKQELIERVRDEVARLSGALPGPADSDASVSESVD